MKIEELEYQIECQNNNHKNYINIISKLVKELLDQYDIVFKQSTNYSYIICNIYTGNPKVI